MFDSLPDPFDTVFKNCLRLMEDGLLARDEVENISKKAGIHPSEFWDWAAKRRESVAAEKHKVSA
jgi:hypothetical protein